MKDILKREGIQPATREQINLRDEAMAGDMVWVATPSTVSTSPTAAAWTRNVKVTLETAAGKVHSWFNKAITSGVSIADTSSAGTASIVPASTLTIENGEATIVVSGDAQAWLGGTAQVESITATGAPSSDGDITLTVTSAGMTGSPKAVVVSLVALTHDDVTKTAAACVVALNADANVGGKFLASNVAGKINLTALVPAANDATLAFAFADTDTTGATFGATADTTAGVAKETDTLTVAEATILGYTISAKTSVETFEA